MHRGSGSRGRRRSGSSLHFRRNRRNEVGKVPGLARLLIAVLIHADRNRRRQRWLRYGRRLRRLDRLADALRRRRRIVGRLILIIVVAAGEQQKTAGAETVEENR